MVVPILTCPRICCTSSTGIPLSSPSVAVVCRIRCGYTRLPIPEVSPNFLLEVYICYIQPFQLRYPASGPYFFIYNSLCAFIEEAFLDTHAHPLHKSSPQLHGRVIKYLLYFSILICDLLQ